MKIQKVTEIEVPDGETCEGCRCFDYGIADSYRWCRIFGNIRISKLTLEPCAPCIEARRKAKVGK